MRFVLRFYMSSQPLRLGAGGNRGGKITKTMSKIPPAEMKFLIYPNKNPPWGVRLGKKSVNLPG